MLNEYQEVDYLLNELNNQLGFFNTNKYNAELLLENTSKLKMKYDIPYLLYITRNATNTYNRSDSFLINDITNTLNLYVKSVLGRDYNVGFISVNKMLFSINKGDLEVVRMSLNDKQYGFMSSITPNLDEMERLINISNTNINRYDDEILKTFTNVDFHKALQSNYFKLFKHIKNTKELYNLVFKSKEVKKGIGRVIDNLNYTITSLNKLKEEEYQNIEYQKYKYKNSIPIIKDMECLFDNIGYTSADRRLFYI